MKVSHRAAASRPRAWSVACGLLVLSGACGDDGEKPAPDAAVPVVPDASVGQEAGPPASPYCTSKPAMPSVTDLSGTWVARAVGAQIVTAPIVGAMHNQNVLTFLVNITQQGTDLVADGRNCNRVQINEPNAAAPVVIPDKWAHTETPVHRPGSFAPGAEGYPVVNFFESTEIIGAVLASPATEALPISSTDPRVIDQDGDGKPGITVVLNGQSLAGTVCAVQSMTTTIRAGVVAPDRVEGALIFTAAQKVLESDPATLGVLYGLGTTTTDPALCNSSFTMVKVSGVAGTDGGATSCAWVRDNEAALFQ